MNLNFMCCTGKYSKHAGQWYLKKLIYIFTLMWESVFKMYEDLLLLYILLLHDLKFWTPKQLNPAGPYISIRVMLHVVSVAT